MELSTGVTWRQVPLPSFFFNDTATTEIYTLSLHDALPISDGLRRHGRPHAEPGPPADGPARAALRPDRKSTRLNSSHSQISYAVFCLKKKKNTKTLVPAPAGNVSSAALTDRRLRQLGNKPP